MTRLTVSYHSDTREPVGVEQYSVLGSSSAGLNLQGGIYGSGPLADQCKALLARERKHWALGNLVRLSEAAGGYEEATDGE